MKKTKFSLKIFIAAFLIPLGASAISYLTLNENPKPSPSSFPLTNNLQGQTLNIQTENESLYTITDFQNQRPSTWYNELYGTSIKTAPDGSYNYCEMQSGYNRCGAATETREIDVGVGARQFQGIRLTLINFTTNPVNYRPFLRASWFDSDWSYALNGRRAVVESQIPVEVGNLNPNQITNINIPWASFSIPGFNHLSDYLGGLAIRNNNSAKIGLIKIELYGAPGTTPEFVQTPHSGGYMIYRPASGAEPIRYDTFNGTGWGIAFQGQTLSPGDIIEVYGVINAGTIIGYYHGTSERPIIFRGMTPDAAFDLKGATRRGQNGGIITLYGNNYIFENLELRNCGLGYNGDENAGAFHTPTENSIFRNLKIHNCGMGFLISGRNNIIENSDIYNNGYFESGYTHNIYNGGGDGHIIRNNRVHHSGGQNIKIRAWKVLVENNLVYYAGNIDVDFAGSDRNPGNQTSIFRGNTVIKSPFSGNQTQLLTFFEDGGAPNAGNKVETLYAVNNTFFGINNPNTAIFRIGLNKTIEANNNLLYQVQKIKMIGNTDREKGVLRGTNNWMPENATQTDQLVNSFLGQNPSLELKNQVYIPLENSPLISNGSNESPLLPTEEYNWPNATISRPSDNQIDIGAFEFGAGEPDKEICTENWICSEWTSCQNSTQNRSCTDLNKCGTTFQKPQEEQSCQVTCEDETVILAKNYTPTGYDPNAYSSVIQAGLRQSHDYYGYDTNDNKLDSKNRYNLKFDQLPAIIPPGKVIKQANLQLSFYQQYTPATLGIYNLLEDWQGNGGTSWKYRQGATNNPRASTPRIAWQTYGGTIDTVPVATYEVSNPQNYYRFEQSFDITSLVRNWLSRGINNGLQLRAENSTIINDIFGINYWNSNKKEYYGPKLALTLGCQP